MSYVEVFLREYKERMKILRRRMHDSLGNLGGSGENGERSEVKKRNGGWGLKGVAEICLGKRGNIGWLMS